MVAVEVVISSCGSISRESYSGSSSGRISSSSTVVVKVAVVVEVVLVVTAVL